MLTKKKKVFLCFIISIINIKSHWQQGIPWLSLTHRSLSPIDPDRSSNVCTMCLLVDRIIDLLHTTRLCIGLTYIEI